jgi:DUF1365 family protein
VSGRAGRAHTAPGVVSTAVPVTPALYECEVGHVRISPQRYALRHRTYYWLVDIDEFPRTPRLLRPLAGFRTEDHFSGTAASIRAGLERMLAARGVECPDGQVLMLAQARVLGFVFNPITVYWCHDRDGRLRHVVAEVHNTYGERHCYLLDASAAEQADVAKEFYVSPFFPVDGLYRMRLPLPGDRLALNVQLERDGGRPFTATLRGRARPYSPTALLGTVLRHPMAPLAAAAAIRFHGIRLYLRRLPVLPRPHHDPQEGMQ